LTEIQNTVNSSP